MPISSGLADHLGGNVTRVIPIWKITATDATVAAYCAHTRALTFSSVLYAVSPIEVSKVQQNIGLKSNNVQLIGVFDDIVTRDNVEAGKWKQAEIRLEYVNYLNLSQGSTGIQRGVVGKIDIIGITYKMELRSLASVLGQTIGDLTSPADRSAFPVGVNPAGFTISRAVTTPITSRRIFTINGAALADHYYRYGVIEFTSGANNGLSMEIQDNVGNLVTLQLPMPYTVAAADGVTLEAGYDGTRAQLRDTYSDVIDMDAEPDLPGLKKIMQFPE